MLVLRILRRMAARFRSVINNNRAELDMGGTSTGRTPDGTAEVIIGRTAYLVSSFFKREAKGDAVDKIRRLIERDSSHLPEK